MGYFKTMLLLAVLTVIYMAVGYLIGGPAGMILALVFGGVTNLVAWWKSDQMVLRMHKARQILPHEVPWLNATVEQLAGNADIPAPKIFVIDSPQPNAFATGRNPENSAIAMTRGIIELLSREELAGVIAHEMAHIKNRDTLIMTITATLAGAISVLAQFGVFFGTSRSSRLGGIGTIILAIFAPMAALVVRMLISRTREYAADRAGAQISGNPMWLASALSKIHIAAQAMRSARRHRSTAHMFIVNPLTKAGSDSWFSTHPSVGNRIKALKEMAEEMGMIPTLDPEPIPVTVDNQPPRGAFPNRLSPWR